MSYAFSPPTLIICTYNFRPRAIHSVLWRMLRIELICLVECELTRASRLALYKLAAGLQRTNLWLPRQQVCYGLFPPFILHFIYPLYGVMEFAPLITGRLCWSSGAN